MPKKKMMKFLSKILAKKINCLAEMHFVKIFTAFKYRSPGVVIAIVNAAVGSTRSSTTHAALGVIGFGSRCPGYRYFHRFYIICTCTQTLRSLRKLLYTRTRLWFPGRIDQSANSVASFSNRRHIGNIVLIIS